MERNQKRLPLWLLLLLQLLLTGAVLLVFATFHHVLPRMHQPQPQPIATIARTETPAPTAAPQPTEAPEAEDEPEETSEAAETPEPAPEATPEPAPLSWAERFADRFSDEPVWEDMHYSSPTMAVTITRHEYEEVCPGSVFFVADVYLSDIELLRTIFPLYGATFAQPVAIAKDADAVLAINSDVFVNQRSAFAVRDGALYSQNKTTTDLCVLCYDGRMLTLSPEEYEVEDVLAHQPWQIWHFGPKLLDAEGCALARFNISELLQTAHPRTAIGYYEPGHYCFVVVDGRQGGSRGATMEALAAIMEQLGCAAAYNLDGGASSVMIFHGKLVNKAVGDRYLNDLIALVEPKEDGA